MKTFVTTAGTVLLMMVVVSQGVHDVPPKNCQQAMFDYCNNDTSCVDSMKADGYEVPIYPLFDRSSPTSSEKEWRCYSPSSLNANKTEYVNGTAYCSRNEQLSQVLAECETNTTFVPVFQPGMSGYPCIRVPSIILAGDNKTLLAFAECRNFSGDGCDPHAFMDLGDASEPLRRNMNRDACMRSSSDGGKTWSPLKVIARNVAQPTPVWDFENDQLVLNYIQLSPGHNLQMISKDIGKTWSDPVLLDKFLGNIVVSDVGPGVGIQLRFNQEHKGRLLFIGHHGAYGYDSVWYSDDGGKTYNVSNATLSHMDEAQLAELPDGRIMANMRNAHYTECKCRGIAISIDGGASFSPVSYAPDLIEPECMASILTSRFDNQVYFANPASTTDRVNGTLRRSRNGLTWPESKIIWPGDYAYSCLTDVSQPNSIGLLWETNSDDCSGPSCQSVFSVISTVF